MTRLGHEGLSLKRDWIGVDELIGSAVRRLNRYMPDALVEVHAPQESLSLFVHAARLNRPFLMYWKMPQNFHQKIKP